MRFQYFVIYISDALIFYIVYFAIYGLYRGRKTCCNSPLYISQSFHLILVCFPSFPGVKFSPLHLPFTYSFMFPNSCQLSKPAKSPCTSCTAVKSSQINHHWLPGSYLHKNSALIHKVLSAPYSEPSSKNIMMSQKKKQSNTKAHSKL